MKILIVDDNQSITGALEKYLTIKGQDVTVANGGRQGLHLIQNKKYDLILLDLSMPEFTGLDVIASLEKDNKLHEQNICLFTASSIGKEQIDDLLEKQGIISCFKKPVKLAEIMQVII